MKPSISFLFASLVFVGVLSAADSGAHKTIPVILDANGIKNLRIQTATVEESDFEETVFALGLIETKPGSTASVSSRISGRVVSLAVAPGDSVSAGAEIVKVESRQPGNPPPVISLAAPIAGLVMQLDVHLGDPVEPEKSLLQITDLSEVYAVARVPEHFVGRMKTGTRAYIGVSALPETKFEGELLRFGTAADSVSGTIDAIFRLHNPENRLRPGMRAEFSIVVAKRTGVVSVPRSALQGEASGRFVYVKDFDLPNAFIKTPVVVGQMNDRFVEIISGLMPADEVVAQGAYSLAFVGGGTVSLKAALDAAHGHEHNEDGSEMTPEQHKGAMAKDADEHEHGGKQSPFWMIVSAVLFALLLVVGFWKKPVHSGGTPSAIPSSPMKKGD